MTSAFRRLHVSTPVPLRLALMLGLVLLMRDGAGEMTASVAREIQKRYRAG